MCIVFIVVSFFLSLSDPRIKEIIEKSTCEWLGYDDVQTIFEFSGVFPLSKGPAAFQEGVYLYEIEHKIDEIEWEFQNHEASVVPGAFRLSYTSAYSNYNPTLAKRVYRCEGEVLCVVHFRKVEETKKLKDRKQKEKWKKMLLLLLILLLLVRLPP